MLTRMISVEQNILVTGSSRGIGRAIADLLHEAGHRVVGHASRPFPDDSPDAPEWDVVAADFGDFRGPDLLWQEAIDLLDGRIDVLINNAGFGVLGAVEETSASETERLFATNVFGVLNVTRAVLPHMRRQRAGHVINISSIGGYQAYMGWGVYGSTKFAVEGITEALHQELAPLGSDTIARIEAKNRFVAEELAEWKDLALSTDFKD